MKVHEVQVLLLQTLLFFRLLSQKWSWIQCNVVIEILQGSVVTETGGLAIYRLHANFLYCICAKNYYSRLSYFAIIIRLTVLFGGHPVCLPSEAVSLFHPSFQCMLHPFLCQQNQFSSCYWDCNPGISGDFLINYKFAFTSCMIYIRISSGL